MPAVSGDIEYIGTSLLDATQLAGVDVTALHDGDLAYLTSTKKFYHLDKSSNAVSDGVLVISTKSSIGRWLIGPSANGSSSDSKKLSGLLVAGATASFGYAADVPNAIASDPIGYPLEHSAIAARIELRIPTTGNPTTNSTTTFTLYKSGVATAITVSYTAGEVGTKAFEAAIVFPDTDNFDLRGDNTGHANDVGKQIVFAGEVSFF